MNLPFSKASENNREPILEVIENWFMAGQAVLEIGSGTGQHAVYFAENLPGVIWQCADQPDYHATINQRVALAGLPNIRSAIALETLSFDWTSLQVDSVFTANTAHIMSWPAVTASFRVAAAPSMCRLRTRSARPAARRSTSTRRPSGRRPT